MPILIDWVSFELYLLISCYPQMNFKAFEIWCVVYILWHDWLQFFQIVLRNISFFSQLWRRAIVLFWAFFQIWVPWLRNVVETGAQAIAITCSQTRHDSREAILFLVCNLVRRDKAAMLGVKTIEIFWFYMKKEFSSQRRAKVLFLTTNISAVTSRANQQEAK